LLATALVATGFAPAAFAQDKSVTIVLSEELDVVEPCMASRSNIGRVILQNISETLTELEIGGGAMKPRLAETWEAVDDDTWRFKLRAGVKFTDGTDFDAEDVIYSLTRTTSDKITCEIGAKYFGGMKLTPVAIDATTLEITSDPPQPILPLLMSTLTIVPTGTDPDNFVREPIGTGPYIFSEWNAGQNIILTRNENEAGGREGDLCVPHRHGGRGRDGGSGRSRHRSEHRGAGRHQSCHRLRLSELRNLLHAH
jgi:peptide/nickel transport system substrate-binding protein